MNNSGAGIGGGADGNGSDITITGGVVEAQATYYFYGILDIGATSSFLKEDGAMYNHITYGNNKSNEASDLIVESTVNPKDDWSGWMLVKIMPTEQANFVNIIFMDGDKELVSIPFTPNTVPTAESLPLMLHIPEKEGKVLVGWVDDDRQPFGEKPITADIKYYAQWDDVEKYTVFHKMTDMSELQVGAHYIIVTPNVIYSRASLSADDPEKGSVTYITQALTDRLIINDMNAENVLTMTSRLFVATGANVRFQTAGGNRLKLGTNSENLIPMFDANGGTITMTYRGQGFWTLDNSERYLAYSEINKFYITTNASSYLEIWTDAQPSQNLGEERYVEYAPLEMDPTNITLDEEMVIVYTAEDGTSYALTVPSEDGSNAVEVNVNSTSAYN